ncbi:hypothetical protein NW754_000548 [Fusarium falciforme]|nr:hypothetical protein NW754_000548 [Fusarium falciforme]
MDLCHVHQLGSTKYVGHTQYNANRHTRCLSMVALEECLIKAGKCDTLQNFFRNHNPQSEDILTSFKNHRLGCLSVEQKLQHNAAASTGASASWNSEDRVLKTLPAQGMVTVDDFALVRVDTSPEAEFEVAGEEPSCGLALDVGGSGKCELV